jgi:YbbR domain-containing protein
MRWIASNIRTFLLALVLAIAVWISAVTSADPDEVNTLPSVPVEIIGRDPSLINTSPLPSTIAVTLRAPRSKWEELKAHSDAVKATLDLSGLGSGEYTLTIKTYISGSVRPVQIVLINPTTISVHLEPITTQTLTIDLSVRGEPAVGYQASQPILDPDKITISGPQSIVKQATQARIRVSLAGTRESIDQSVNVEVVDAQNNPVKGLTISPELVHVGLPITQQGGFRDVAVKVVVQGQQAPGYRLENISVFPPVITIFSANPEAVNSLPGVVETTPLNIQDSRENITAQLSLNIPKGVAIVGSSNTVQVSVGISAIQTSITLTNQEVKVVGLPEGLASQVSPQTIDVIISGPLPVLDALTAQDVRVTVDVTGLEPGTHQLTPKVELLVSNVLVESILPGTVEVILSIPDTPTPTPKP